jgi:O-antigen ligase
MNNAEGLEPSAASAEQHSEPTRLSTAIVLLLFVFPIFGTLAYGAVETWSFGFLSIVAGLLAAAWIADGISARQLRISRSVLQVPLAALIAVGLVQLLPLGTPDAPSVTTPVAASLSLNSHATRVALIQLLIQLLFFAAALVYFDSARRIRRLTMTIVVFSAMMAFFGILQWLANPQGIYGWRPTPQAIPFGSFVNQHHFAALMVMTVGPVLALVVGGSAEKEKRLLLIIAGALMAVAVVLTGSRGGLLSLLVTALFVAVAGVKRADDPTDDTGGIPYKLKIAGFGIAFTAMLIGAVLWLGGDESLMRGVGATAQTDVSSGRFHFWGVAVRVFLDHPIFGAGLDAFATAFPAYDTWNGNFRVEQAHNDYLQILADAGIAGFACAASFVFLFFRKGLRLIANESNAERRSIAVGAFAGCTGVLVHSFFDFPLRTPANAFVFLLLAVLATSGVRFRRRHRSHRH